MVYGLQYTRIPTENNAVSCLHVFLRDLSTEKLRNTIVSSVVAALQKTMVTLPKTTLSVPAYTRKNFTRDIPSGVFYLGSKVYS